MKIEPWFPLASTSGKITSKDDATLGTEDWPGNIPAVAAVLESGLELPEGVAFLMGENGSGKF